MNDDNRKTLSAEDARCAVKVPGMKYVLSLGIAGAILGLILVVSYFN